ncbi:hypothetical protein ACIHCQ_42995 [Streptomyces sp. NPDC052236]|uniref:hypothetical protein n=1 Tax=Streptomyces sp. NPDC052236 TaxID=3365686 RepID=UPI0037D283DD
MSRGAHLAAHSAVSASLAPLSDRALQELVDAAVPIGSGIGGKSALLEVAGTPVFVKRVSLTDRRGNRRSRSTANLFDVTGRRPLRRAEPEYVLSLYWLTSSPRTGSEYDIALRLLSTPSVLVDRGATGGPAPLDGSVEESLLSTGLDHPDIVSFGVRGVSTGYAGWSGVSYAAISPERSLTIEDLVSCELTVQALWCFTRQIQQLIEDGQDPSMPERYGWRFLRAAYSRLTTARAQETAQHCLMREAIMKTSGLAERLRAAQDALRESVG